MAPVSEVKSAGGRVLSREDCVCPICLEIYLEPVTLPCSHAFCKVCFMESVDKASLSCPLCRKRVSTWVRFHSRNNTLVDKALWEKIQRRFPQSNKNSVLEEETEEPEKLYCPKLSEPGALRQEYEDQVYKLTQEKQELEEQERRASEEFIQRLLADEEEVLKERRKRAEEDEQLARQLSMELNSVSEQNSASEAPLKKKPFGQMDRFLCVLPKSPALTSHSNKENLMFGHSSSPILAQEESVQSHSEETGHRDRPAVGGTEEKGVEVECEEELQRRRRQEEEDLRFALELQQQLDRQQRQERTDRRKGSEDAYLLRANATPPARKRLNSSPSPSTRRKRPTPSATVSRSDALSEPSGSTTTCFKSPKNINRQTTLTDLFNHKL